MFRNFGLLFVLVACPVMGQVLTKKPLEVKDYSLWSTLQTEGISDVGGWVSYKMKYASGNDTLFVKQTKGSRLYSFVKGYDSSFKKEQYFVCMLPDNRLQIQNLKDGSQHLLENVTSYFLSKKLDCLVLQCKNSQRSWVEIRTLDGLLLGALKGVYKAVLNSMGTQVLCFSSDGLSAVFVFDLKALQSQVLLEDSQAVYTKAVWDKNGTAVAFIQIKKDSTLANVKRSVCYYSFKMHRLYKFDSDEFDTFPQDMFVSSDGKVALSISDDGARVFFGIMLIVKEAIKQSDVQQWNANDTLLYPLKHKLDGWKKIEKAGVWFPMEQKFLPITTNLLPKFVLNGDQKYAITFNPYQGKTLGSYDALSDYYITDLATGVKTLFLPQQTIALHSLLISPGGKYVLYFRDSQWYAYVIATNTHVALTKKLPVSFVDAENQFFETEASGVAGWTENDASVLIYDSFDLWNIVPGKTSERITDGSAKQLKFQVVFDKDAKGVLSSYDGGISPVVSLKEGMLLKASCGTDLSSGYFTWQAKRGVQPLVYGLLTADQLVKACDAPVYVYREQYYDVSPRLVLKSDITVPAQVIVQSNTQQAHYLWGKSELVYYTNSKGTKLKGALFYPAGYDATKKYPMIVSIYQLQSHFVSVYQNPSEYNLIGFNITNLVTKGYFVLLPDIVYEQGKAGNSAVDCVVSATNAIIERGLVERSRIGLIGHSFGGYETNFIITQTSLFAAAISSSGFTDLVSGYFSVGWNRGTPEFWRYEKQQLRIGKSFYEDKEAYVANSPLWHAEKVETPLFSWVGEEDRQVHYYQSIAFHLALRRLNKPNILLIYPKEAHVLGIAAHQQDLTSRITDWFGYYLKNEPLAGWIKEGIE